MPKTYPTPEQKQNQEKETPRKTVGIYEHQERTGASRGVMLALAIIAAIIVIFVIYRYARGEQPLHVGVQAPMVSLSAALPSDNTAS